MSVILSLAAPAAAGYELGAGRLVPSVAALVGLVSVIVGWRALARSRRAGSGNGRSMVALSTGLISVVVGALHAANSAGGFGTGNGLAGALVALVLGLVGMVIGGLALARSRRSRLRIG